MSSLERPVRRTDRLMTDEEARAYLKAADFCYVGTVSEDGWPYVLPLVFVYEGGDILWLHNGKKPGHLLANLTHDSRICLTVGERGDLIPGQEYACQSRQAYQSVVAFGRVELVEDEAQKNWFFDQLLAKHAPGHRFPNPTYPANDRIYLWKMTIEKITGKRSDSGAH